MSHALRTTQPSAKKASAASSRAEAERAARRLPATAAIQTAASARSVQRPEPEDEGWYDRWRRRLLGEEGASWGVSVLVHLVILAVCAIPVISHVTRNEPLIATVVAEASGGGSPFGLPEMINTELAPALPLANAPLEQATPDLAAVETLAVSKALFGTPQGEGGEGTAAGSGTGAGEVGHGTMQFVPKNAVRAGSFAAWTTPVFDNRFPRPFGAPDPQPGDPPRPLQKYWITIQLKVPEGRRRFPVRDLTGEIIGTDGYTQKIPDHTFELTDEGKLLPLGRRKVVRVVDGVVQFVVVVPGARDLVKDTIVVKSKLLKEEQEMELVFQGSDDRDFRDNL